MTSPSDFDAKAFRDARARLDGALHRTPLVSSRTLSDRLGVPVWLKCENLQRTGAFKVRGALNRLLTLDAAARARGVATISAGNHAQAVAWAAARTGTHAVVVMPAHASRTKVEASRGYGAEVILHGDAHAAFARAAEVCEERGLTFVHPFDDPEVVLGHGTCALEIAEDLGDVGTVVVPVGGGGLASGLAAAFGALHSGAEVWGVEPNGANAMTRSFSEGRPVHLESVGTVADGLAAPMAGVLNYRLLVEHAAGMVTVDDPAIVDAMVVLLERTKLLVEPAGAAGLAALLEGRIPIRTDRPAVVVLSGGNVDPATLARLIAERTGP